MKKVACVLAVLAMCVASTAVAQETLQLRIVKSDGSNSHNVGTPGEPVAVVIQGRLNTTTSAGLALWGANLTSSDPAYDLCVETAFVSPGAPIDNFVKNLGLTNPAGYGGTCNGMGGLWQIGGGQNTIGNTGPTAYPVGPVASGVANGTSWTTLAADTIGAPDASGGNVVLALDTGFANTIDAGQAGPVYSVTAANVSIVDSLTFTAAVDPYACGAGLTPASPPCSEEDVDCNGIVNALDIAAVTSSANFGKTVGSGDPPAANRADVDRNTIVNVLDVAAVQSSACFGQTR